ncbi:MAG: tRNA uridine-5-carboxymethylaminomethyl(34) synthesis enzyme MnmG [Bdellovibrionales bacterium]|nr:tRNA uridine-5-carboxymethylaminomethyl(34) synthesis enzyme MnmG [Bdellovibrionales bacterium]
MEIFDVIVVGSGHAGVEAAYAAARRDCSVLIVTVDKERTAHMSCNPSIGGLGKGHIVKELDILGGLMGRAADASCIQFKLLNRSKGPAVRGSRAQCDKHFYSAFVKKYLFSLKEVSVLSAEVKTLVLDKNKCKGVITDKGEKILSKTVILTTGTFMKGMMYIGSEQKSGGRVGEKATTGLSDQLKTLGFPVHRLKTGTPPRLKKESIDFSSLIVQKGDPQFRPFSFFSSPILSLPQISCHLTYTNEKTHEIIRKNLHLSALHSGAIQGVGPRYCPSVEDKIIRFADKDRHQSFLEPETLKGTSIYLQGLSTSLPEKIQLAFLRTIKGLEKVEILKPGYAVEYDFLDPQMLFSTLETKLFENLFFAGQINGTSGYEEAAGQGLVAGVNAASKVQKAPPLILKRQEAYIGVLIDDLVTKGTKEPYRMLTSRAEHRLILREDNAIERLFHLSREHHLLSSKKLFLLERELERREKLLNFLKKTQISPKEKIKEELKAVKAPSLNRVQTLKVFFSRPEMDWRKMKTFIQQNPDLKHKLLKKKESDKENLLGENTEKSWESVEIQIKYEGYIKRQEEFIAQNQKLENIKLPKLDYDRVKGLSLEALEKLKKVKPRTLAQASRISGMPPAAIQALLIHLKINTKTNYTDSV